MTKPEYYIKQLGSGPCKYSIFWGISLINSYATYQVARAKLKALIAQQDIESSRRYNYTISSFTYTPTPATTTTNNVFNTLTTRWILT